MNIDSETRNHFERDRAFHDRTAHLYDAVVTEPRQQANRHLFRRIEHVLPTGGDMLDLACGTGHMLARYGARFDRLVGVDQSAGMLDRAAGNLKRVGLQRTRLEQASVFDFLARDGSRYDLVSCVGFVHHLPPPLFDALLAGIVPRLAGEGAVLLLAEPVQPAVDRAPWPIARWNAGSVMAERAAWLDDGGEDAEEGPLPPALFLDSPARHGLRRRALSRGWELFPRRLPERGIDRLAIWALDAWYWRSGYIVVQALTAGQGEPAPASARPV